MTPGAVAQQMAVLNKKLLIKVNCFRGDTYVIPCPIRQHRSKKCNM